MFTIKLTYINNYSDFLENRNDKYALLYADFNVVNYLYETNFNMDTPNIILYPDSTAVSSIIRMMGDQKYKKLVSTDLLDEFLHILIISKRKIFFFGNSDEVLKEMVEKLHYKYPDIIVCGYHNGYDYDNSVISKINKSGAEILFVGLGASRQEKWIVENFGLLNCKLIISCGGWFNLLSGNKKRAPLFVRKLHLEWLYKLMTEFKNTRERYLIGIPKFFYRVFSKEVVLIIKQ
ncbi:MAG: WecB/TagA/CpsF family glycosyltransferase [Ignavibacteria bacterium]|nr:WecB/TagA/CpsF family glycosyltransferase [Ignavibacteria bacterium]